MLSKGIKVCLLGCVLMCGTLLSSIYAEGEKGIRGTVVTDPDAAIDPNSYVTFSAIRENTRYYLGIDTIAANAGKDTLIYYPTANYATMWRIGDIYSPDGSQDESKYLRTLKNVWSEERRSENKWLALGENKGSYSLLTLSSTATSATQWNINAVKKFKKRYIEGYLYYHAFVEGTEITRYVTYSPLYGFSRALSKQPTELHRMSVWTRTTAADDEASSMRCTFLPYTYTFGLETERDMTYQEIKLQLHLYLGGDMFKSRNDNVEFYVKRPQEEYNQETLHNTYKVKAHLDWSSSTEVAEKKVYSLMPYKQYYTEIENDQPVLKSRWIDSIVMWVDTNHITPHYLSSDPNYNYYTDTIYAIGKSPRNVKDTNDNWFTHRDWLHVHMSYGGKNFIDSALVIRQTFHDDPYTVLTTAYSPESYQFPYYSSAMAVPDSATAYFEVSAEYVDGNRILYANGNVARDAVGYKRTLDIANTPTHRDTIWREEVLNAGTEQEETRWVVDTILKYDTLMVKALMPDGVTSVIYNDVTNPSGWLEFCRLSARNTIEVKARPVPEDAVAFRTAQIQFSYTYYHSSAEGDTARAEDVIWLTQSFKANNDEIYSFNHYTGAGDDAFDANGRQQVHGDTSIIFNIPGGNLPLPIRQDYWGWYRWYNYTTNSGNGRDITNGNNWQWIVTPKTEKNNGNGEFLPINDYQRAASRGRFAIDGYFDSHKATNIPIAKALTNPTTRRDLFACDVSAYYDTTCVGNLGNNTLTSLTEPTLSYRQIFDIRPASERADSIALCTRSDSTSESNSKFLNNHIVIVPQVRSFMLEPGSPVKQGGGATEGDLQYVYYYNPNETDNADPKMGTSTGLDKAEPTSYHRVGGEIRTTGFTEYHAELLSYDYIRNTMQTGDELRVMMVNPRNGSGYIFGKTSDASSWYETWSGTHTNVDSLRRYIDTTYLSSGKYDNSSALFLILRKTADDKISIRHEGTSKRLFHYAKSLTSYGLDWSGDNDDAPFTIDHPTWDASLISNANNASMRLWSKAYPLLGILLQQSGYLTASKFEWGECIERNWIGFCTAYREVYTPSLAIKSEVEDRDDEDKAIQAWLFFKIVKEDTSIPHEERPRWEKSTNGTTWQTLSGTDKMLDNGFLEASLTRSETTAYFRLRTQHLQLDKFTVLSRSMDVTGPRATPIISNDSIKQYYSIIRDLGLDQFEEPGTDEMVTTYHHFPWKFTGFAYHYPVGDGEHEIPAGKRVFSGTLPERGEYCLINKFVKDGHPTIESREGARHGYMYCVNRGTKTTVFLDFEHEQTICPDQDLILMADYANPCSSRPQVQAELYGWANGKWNPIYTFITGYIPTANISENKIWYQMCLKMDYNYIKDYNRFRCVARVSGTMESEGYLLIDRLRLVTEKKPVTVAQENTICHDNDTIFASMRINFRHEAYLAGDLICYQFQKQNPDGSYSPLKASRKTGESSYEALPANETEVYPGYLKDGMTSTEGVESAALKDADGEDYGLILMPEKDYHPDSSYLNVYQSNVRKTLIGQIKTILSDGDNHRDAFANETINVRTREDVTKMDIVSFGGVPTPHIKSYVNEGTTDKPQWVIYVTAMIPQMTGVKNFRIALARIDDLSSEKPNFSSDCAIFRPLTVKKTTDILVDGELATNMTRAQAIEADKLLPANNSYAVTLQVNADNDTVGTCRFDIIRADSLERNYFTLTGDALRKADSVFFANYGCTPVEFDNVVYDFRRVYPTTDRFSDVKVEDFVAEGFTQERADSIYSILHRFIVTERWMQIGLSERDVYIANKQDAYFWIYPIPATGYYNRTIKAKDGVTDSIVAVPTEVCSNPQWLELHSTEVPQELRFGYDHTYGDSYLIPIIRATKWEANNELTVRVAALTNGGSTGVVIGWDSTQVVETNDPKWIAGESTFRYTQDRIVQERLYRDYYKTGDTITFRPVNSAHITALTAAGCDCYDYYILGANDPGVYHVDDNPTGMYHPVDGVTEKICNQWHVRPNVANADAAKRQPGYQVANNYELRAGYWYKFRTSFFSTPNMIPYNEGGDAQYLGNAYFILAIAPDTVRWEPAHEDDLNYWNDDDNWMPVVNGVDFNESHARVPMKDTKVIIPAPEQENHLPIVNNDSLGVLEWGFRTATCGDILFKPLSLIYGQELLDYKRAFADVRFLTGQWRTFTPVLNNIYSADIYVPAAAANGNDPDFAPLRFDDEANGPFSEKHNREWPYAVYQAYYNKEVSYAYLDENETLQHKDTFHNVEWLQTNSMTQELIPGQACAMVAYGPTDVEDSAMIVRLPKQENTYHYIGTYGEDLGTVTITRDEFNSITQNLSYDKTALKNAGGEGITYSIPAETAADVFFFGNPTMEYIDIYELCKDNAGQLLAGDKADSYKFTVYELVEGSTYQARVVTMRGQYYVAPMRAVGLLAKTPRTQLDIVLKPSALVGMRSGTSTIDIKDPAKKSLPSRIRKATSSEPARLYIAALNETNAGMVKSYVTLSEEENASNGYVRGEDVPEITSGTTNFSYVSFHTPMSMYTICDNQSMLYDVRDEVTSVPLSFTFMTDKYDFAGHTMLYFSTSGEWSEDLYLYDAVGQDSILITNGLCVAITTPNNNEHRYYINSHRSIDNPTNPNDPGVATDVENIDEPSHEIDAYTAIVYDLLGRPVAKLDEWDLITSLDLPKGVYIIQRGESAERVVIK